MGLTLAMERSRRTEKRGDAEVTEVAEENRVKREKKGVRAEERIHSPLLSSSLLFSLLSSPSFPSSIRAPPRPPRLRGSLPVLRCRVKA
jgi:hypothetical protein